MMMHSGDHTVQPPSNTTPHQLTQQQHQQNNYMYRTSTQQAMNTFAPPPPPPPATPATPQTQTMAQPHQLHKYGPARTHGQQPQTSPYTPNTASMSHTKAPTTTQDNKQLHRNRIIQHQTHPKCNIQHNHRNPHQRQYRQHQHTHTHHQQHMWYLHM